MAREENPIYQGRTPEDQQVLGEFLSSPLSRLVMDIELAKEGVKKTNYGQGSRNISKALANPLSAEHAIERNHEFKELWQQPFDTYGALRIGADESIVSKWKYHGIARRHFLNILAYGDFKTKLLVTSEPFRKYMKAYGIAHETRGPYFLRVLSNVEKIDQDSISVISSSPQALANLDQQYFWLKSRFNEDKKSEGSDVEFKTPVQIKHSEDCRIAFDKFNEITDHLLDTVFDTKDKSEWKQFVLDNFNVISRLTSIFHMPVEEYDPHEQYDRLKDMFDKSSDEAREFLAPYASFSRHIAPDKAQSMDNEILNGQYDRALAFTKFWAETIPAGSIFFDLKEKQALDYWCNKFVEGQIDSDQLLSIPENVYTIYKEVKHKTKPDKHQKAIADLCKTEGIFIGNSVAQLLQKGIVPTLNLAKFVNENNDDAFEELNRLKKATENGNFERSNKLQMDLEYAKYLDLTSIKTADASYENFSQIPYNSEFGTTPIVLTDTDRMEARAAAIEASRVFWVVKERIDAGRKVLVVGNERYGKNFVVDPITADLEEIGARVASSYIRSADGYKQYIRVFNQETLKYVASEQPDIVVVDGTATPTTGNEKARYSRAMQGFYNWVNIFNEGASADVETAEKTDEKNSDTDNLKVPQDKKYWSLRNRISALNPESTYDISFVSAYSMESVMLGHIPVDVVTPNDTNPRFIIVNSTIEPSMIKGLPEDLAKHSPAYFDDPENKSPIDKKIVFTPKGLEEVQGKKVSTGRYIAAAKQEIKKAIPEMMMHRASSLYS